MTEASASAPAPQSYHCLDLWALPPALSQDVSPATRDARDRAVASQVKSSVGKPFPDNALTAQAPLSLLENAVAVAALLVMMGGPLLVIALAPLVHALGTWRHVAAYWAVTLFLALHPLPELRDHLQGSFLVRAWYKYFSYRFVWTDDCREQLQQASPWMGAGVPHGVLPFANLLSIPAINAFSFVGTFQGAPASAVFRTPFLRLFTMLGCCDVSARRITRELEQGRCVGLVPDGIAGIFQCNAEDEVVYLRHRKGLAKLALRTGRPLVPAYSLGNTAAFSAWYDSYGVMEYLSRKAQVSVFLYWGRYFLPIPHRTNITMICGPPIHVVRNESPTPAEVDAVHERLLAGIKHCFDAHKGALGWGHKQMRFV